LTWGRRQPANAIYRHFLGAAVYGMVATGERADDRDRIRSISLGTTINTQMDN
jgi:hypothetical protein